MFDSMRLRRWKREARIHQDLNPGSLAWAASALAYWATMRTATDGHLWHKMWFTMPLYVKCMFSRKLNLLSPLILAISFAGRTRTLSPSWMCPDSIRPVTLNPDPWAEEGRRRARRHLVIWSFHGCNSYYEAHINNMHTHTKWKPLKMSAMQHLNGFSMGRIGGTNWSVDIKKT